MAARLDLVAGPAAPVHLPSRDELRRRLAELDSELAEARREEEARSGEVAALRAELRAALRAAAVRRRERDASLVRDLAAAGTGGVASLARCALVLDDTAAQGDAARRAASRFLWRGMPGPLRRWADARGVRECASADRKPEAPTPPSTAGLQFWQRLEQQLEAGAHASGPALAGDALSPGTAMAPALMMLDALRGCERRMAAGLPLYRQPCEAPAWTSNARAHTLQRSRMLDVLALRRKRAAQLQSMLVQEWRERTVAWEEYRAKRRRVDESAAVRCCAAARPAESGRGMSPDA